MFLSSPIVHELVHKQFFFFLGSRLVYQTSLKITNEHKRAFYQIEPELFMNSWVHLRP